MDFSRPIPKLILLIFIITLSIALDNAGMAGVAIWMLGFGMISCGLVILYLSSRSFKDGDSAFGSTLMWYGITFVALGSLLTVLMFRRL